MGRMGKILFAILSILYPCLVFIGLVYLKTPPRMLSLCVAVVVIVNFLAATGEAKKTGKRPVGKYVLAALLALLVLTVFLTNSEALLKFYPVVMSASLLVTFGVTLFRKPSMILRFAALQDKRIKDSPDYPDIARYCWRVTLVWCAFFVCNMLAALYTTLFSSRLVWSLYNGLISYILIGILFLGEMVVRHFVQKK